MTGTSGIGPRSRGSHHIGDSTRTAPTPRAAHTRPSLTSTTRAGSAHTQ
ncbi:hypothetical protein LWF15_29175 [Kineosporia rhizophila]|nr:hypothetical protein [Kineosporia rhizophila]MCE0539580.1 hypothetical protein [Kineosporia rhizophila]